MWNAMKCNHLSLCPLPNHMWHVVLMHIEAKVKTVKDHLVFFDRFPFETLAFLTDIDNWKRSRNLTISGRFSYRKCTETERNKLINGYIRMLIIRNIRKYVHSSFFIVLSINSMNLTKCNYSQSHVFANMCSRVFHSSFNYFNEFD